MENRKLVEEKQNEEMTDDLLRERQEQRRQKRSRRKSRGGVKMPAGDKRRKFVDRLRRVHPLTAAIVIIIVLMAANSVRNIAALEIEHYRLKKQNRELTEERDTLRIELKNVNSREYIEEQARKQLRLADPDEIMFVFPDE